MILLRSTHARILAEGRKAAQDAITKADESTAYWRHRARIAGGIITALTEERDAARAQLSKFTGPRERDAKGHFVKVAS